ncbi:MAG TPA: hypothetical protein VD970_13110 [Acetobacteraceae bacterium]|nr:hypothetical protein [Acetobacteraceae bacterium]
MAVPTRRLALALSPLILAAVARAQQEAGVVLFRVAGMREDIIIGLTPAELAALGTGPEAERIARRLVEAGQVGAWRYVVGRAPDGTTRYNPVARIALIRQETVRIEPYRAAIPVAPPPG